MIKIGNLYEISSDIDSVGSFYGIALTNKPDEFNYYYFKYIFSKKIWNKNTFSWKLNDSHTKNINDLGKFKGNIKYFKEKYPEYLI